MSNKVHPIFQPIIDLIAPPPAPVVECETCRGSGTIDETLGGEHFSNPRATCPDCDGLGEFTRAAQ